MRESNSFQNDPVIKRARQQSNFRAIKDLVEAENSIRVAHNRIKVLQIQEEKNQQKLHNQMGLIDRIQYVRQESQQREQHMEMNRSQMQMELEEAKNKNQELLGHHKSRIKEVFEEIKKSKNEQYLTLEEQSLEAERIINESRKLELEEKEKNRIRMASDERQGRLNLIKFHQGKQGTIRHNKALEVSAIKSKQSAKYRELKQLGNLEMKMIQKQSESQVAYLQVKSKLDALLNNVKMQNLSKKSLQPSFHIGGRENQPAF